MIPFIDRWICDRVGLGPDPSGPADALEVLEDFQAAALRRTLAHAAGNSRFYADRLSGISPDGIRRLKGISHLPFTWPADLQGGAPRFACLSQEGIDRIVTLESSGTTDRPKRLLFTREDLEMTVDFFAACLGTLMTPGDRGLIFLPGAIPASAGDLIRQAMVRIGAEPRVRGLVTDPAAASAAAAEIREFRPCVIIGMPVQVLSLGEMMAGGAGAPEVPWIILTADHVSPPVAARIGKLFSGGTLSHYGLTETGFGGALQCPAGEGLHIRHPHLVVEIVDPETGVPLPHGDWGEITLTTLDRRAMPLIRYRTGDMSRLLASPCPCGSPFPRLDHIRNRNTESVLLGSGLSLTMADLDDALFGLEKVVDFSAEIYENDGVPVLSLGVETLGPPCVPGPGEVKACLENLAGVRQALGRGRLSLGDIEIRTCTWDPPYIGKRLIRDLRPVPGSQ